MTAVPTGRRRWVAPAVLGQLVIVAAAVAGQLSARLIGQEYLLRVGPYDPIDPFRGAYVALAYPELPTSTSGSGNGTVFVPLIEDGALRKGGTALRTPPPDGPFLRCNDEGWRLRCGIESWFLPQATAAAAGRALAEDRAVAVVRVDGRGNAALVEVRPRG